MQTRRNATRARRLSSVIFVWGLAVVAFSNCACNPNVRKAKYLQRGTRYFSAGKYSDAVLEYKNVIKIDPGYVDAHYQLAQCYQKLGMWGGASAELVRTLDLQPTNRTARIDLGNLLLASRQPQRAIEEAQRVLSADPNNADAHALLANTQAALGNRQDSLREMQTAIQLAPGRREFYLNLALLQDTAKQTAAAEENYKKAIQTDPKSATAVLAIANFYAEQRRWPEAEQQFQKAIGIDPTSAVSRWALARLYMVEGQNDGAEKVLKQAKQDLSTNSEAYRMLGDFYVSTGDLNKAGAEYAALFVQHPRDLRVKKNYVQLLILLNQVDKATALNDEILKQNPGDVDGLICRGQILNRGGRANEAILALQTALKSEPDNSTARYQLGLALSLRGDLARAESEWREVVRLHPNAVEAQRALAEVAVRKGDFRLLHDSAEALIRAEPASPQGYVLRAASRLAAKDSAGAEADLKKSIELAPRNPLGYSRLGILRFSQRRLGEAEKLYGQALDRDPNSVEALQGLVAIDMAQKQPAKALARVNAQSAKVPGNAAYYVLQAQVLARTGDLQKAESALERAVELNKNNADALLMLARVQEARGSREHAAASYQRLIQQNPRDIRSYVLLGALEETQGNWQEAEQLYRKALDIDPDYSLANNNLAYLMLQHGGNVDVALSLAQTARLRMPEDPHVADTLAWAYCQKGAYATAIELLKQALQKAPDDATYHYHIGLAYEKADHKAQAREHFKRAVALNPSYAQASEILKAGS